MTPHTHDDHEHEVATEARFVIKPKDINEEISWAQINEDVLSSLERPRPPLYWVIFFASLGLFCFDISQQNGPHSTETQRQGFL